MAIVALDHLQLAMPIGAEEQARQFYCGVLGMTLVPKPEPMAARGGMWLTAGSVNVHLGVETNFAPAKKAHPAFIVDNFEALMATLELGNYPVKIDTELTGTVRFFTEDCFGNRIELIDAKSANIRL